MTEATNTPDPTAELTMDVIAAIRELKRKHRELFRADPKAFREIVRRACARVLRLKPGPKPHRNPHIPKAARKHGRGTPWKDLYPAHIPGWPEMNEYTRSYAEDGFRRQINDYLSNHPRLKLPRGTRARDPAPKSGQ